MSSTLPSPAATPRACAIPGTPLAQATPGLDACVHCGFCLQACPTYLALSDENDSPRGRLVLMRALVEGEVSLDDPDVHTHIDRCLGCRGCETACPSGVPYGQLLEATRATLATRRPPPTIARVILGTFERPWALGAALALARLARALKLPRLLSALPGRVGFAFAMLRATERPLAESPYTPTGDGSRGTVAVLHGCVMQGLFAATNRATERVLVVNDYRLVDATGEGCCGALHAHAGNVDAARRLARRNIEAFERSGADLVAVNASGCGAMMKEYAHLLHDDPDWSGRALALASRVRDVSELLAAAGPRRGAPLPLHVTYDAPCHLVHAQRITTPPLAVLSAIPDLRLTPLTDADQCCGGAGIYNLVEAETSDAVLTPKLAHIAETGAALVATGNPGCLMQVGAGLARAGSTMRVLHPVDLLDASYGRRPAACVQVATST
ncbi:MAG: 4Fe-4S dicluster domain-containing protein [Gemmatimonadaceae bacterium]|nr:4Fe-4S dicluster domain-containing protein [Gemmatimonadaceae bacterium]